MRQNQSFGTGDINLAAAITTMGVPPDPTGPVELIARDNGRDYTRFHFLAESYCGKYTPDQLSRAWADPRGFTATNPEHPFSLLMEFIASRPRGCSLPDDWMDHAAGFLGISADVVRITCQGIESVCKASPESPVAYLCAFIVNRSDLIAHTHRKAQLGNHSNMLAKGKSITLIPEKAPRHIRDHLLSQ
jgi:hypothetical protein